ncbi:hypothetical protein BABINDRAFT_11482 [Babjeviella inositovora NRRL Y-12698]|uniref:Uncharacterized protein n=1 Tax=Babjeviella inositovora NRRL Y-12698 TaxID=984486 RepID=A0A1E3R1E0_9ASCO|nr:uncharacterized protein BABINDRAFT_11482 [Babjeviella inositovora NRRL Y-12698]ODQ83182.1 hypothetical protein BABINDRAFT_11482 [Babjeviella inositovora NRRL Y-12698]
MSVAAPQTYGGDEVAAIVLDPGSHTTRAGYAGLDTPSIIIPSTVASDGRARYFGDAVYYPRADCEVTSLYRDSVVQDWDAVTSQWEHIFRSMHVADFQEHPLMVTEPVWNDKANRLKTMEVALEHFGFAGTYLVKTPSAVSFAHGRPSCLVVDIGADTTSVTAVVDGLSLVKSTMRTHYAGGFISAQVRGWFPDTTPQFRVASKTPTSGDAAPIWTPRLFDFPITQSFDAYQTEKIIEEAKETCLQTRSLGKEEVPVYDARAFELPNGHSVTLDAARYKAVDAIFTPADYLTDGFVLETGEPELKGNDYKPLKRKRKEEDTPQPEETPQPRDVSVRGLSDLVSAALSLIDIDIRSQLAHNIVVTGASSLIPGLTERLHNDLVVQHPGLKVRLHCAGNVMERKYLSWIGGNVLASLGTFHQMWVSKREWEEEGERFLSDLPGCTLVLQNIPVNSLFGINFLFFTNTETSQLRGIKNIPVGTCFFHLSLDGGNSIRHGFVFDSSDIKNKILMLTWDSEAETLVPNGRDFDAQVNQIWLSYPFMINYEQASEGKPVDKALTSYIDQQVLSRLLPTGKHGHPMSSLFASKQENRVLSEALIQSARDRVLKRLRRTDGAIEVDVELEIGKDPIIRSLTKETAHELDMCVIDFKAVRPHATPAQITLDAMDKSWYLTECLVNQHYGGNYKYFLGEFQVCFNLMVLYSNYCAYLQWLNILKVMAISGTLVSDAKGSMPMLVVEFLEILRAQLLVLPVGYLVKDNGMATLESLINYAEFVKIFKELYRNVVDGGNYTFLELIQRIKGMLVAKFGARELDSVSLDLDDEDGPVVVEM